MTSTSSETSNPLELQECQQQLQLVVQHQKILARILAKIRASIDLKSLCSTSCQDICRQLQAERVTVYRFNPDWSGQFINHFGFAEPPWDAMKAFGHHSVWDDSHLQETQGGRYRTNESFAIADIYEAGHSRCHLELLEQFQIRAYAIAPIFVGLELWGLLAAYQHSAPRKWRDRDVEFLGQAASYLGVAMQQAETQDRSQHSTTQLQDAILRQRTLTEVVGNIRSSLDTQVILDTACQELCTLLRLERAAVYRFNADWSGTFISHFGTVDIYPDKNNAFGEHPRWEDTHLQETQGGRYRNNESFAVNDIEQAGHSRCHLDLLRQYKIRAYALAPIFSGAKLWGLIAAYQHSGPRQWAEFEIEFLSQVGAQLGVAIQQSEHLTQSKQQEIALQDAIARQRALTEVVGNIRSSVDTQVILDTVCQELCKLLKLERAAVYQFNPDWSGTFISHFGTIDVNLDRRNAFGENPVWEDTHLQETQGGRYRNNESFAVNDIYQAGHSRCHLDLLAQYKIRAYALAPIFSSSKLWGLIAAYQHSGPRQWAEFEIEFLEQVGAQLGVAIQQAENLAQSKQQAIALQDAIARQRALTEVVSKIRSSLNIDLILQTTCQEVCNLLKLERVAVYQFKEDWSGVFISYSSSVDVQWSQIDPFGETPVWQDTYLQETQGGRYRNNESFTVNDIYQAGHSRCHLDLLKQYKIRAYTLTPIFVGQSLWGLLAAYQHSSPRQWSKVEVEFLAQVASQLGVALQSAHMLAQVQTRADQLHQSAERRRILFNLVVKLRDSLDLEAIFNNTVQEVRRSLQTDRVSIFRFDLDSNFCRGEFIAEAVQPRFESALAVKVQDASFGEQYAPQYRQGQVQVIPDIQSFGMKVPHLDAIERFQVKAQILVPLMEGEELWGLLCIHHCTQARQWQKAETEFATQIAAQLSVALHQANLFQQSSLLGQTRQEANQLALALNELRKAQMQIVHAEKMASLGQLVAGVAHEINNPINFIHGNLDHANEYAQTLICSLQSYQEHCPNAVPADLQRLLQTADLEFITDDLPQLFQSMKVGCDRIRSIVTSLRNFSRLDEAEFKPVNIHEGIDSTLMILQNRLKPSVESPTIHVTKDYDELPLVECYPGQLNQVFMNLLTNATDALDERHANQSSEIIATNPSEIRITTTLLNPDWIAIRIADNGPGMTEDVLSRLFDPFFTTKSVGKGTGLGLSISYQIVTDKHNGKLYCHSETGKGTEFFVELPIRQMATRKLLSEFKVTTPA